MLLVVIGNSYSPGNIMTFTLMILMPLIAYKEPLISGKIMILLLITIIPQITHKDNIMTLWLIAIMPQIIYKEFIPCIFLAFFYLHSMPLKNHV